MDAQSIRRALYDFLKFNPKDFLVKGSPTGYQVELARGQARALATPPRYMHPWQCYITNNEDSYVKIKINEYSCLMKGQSAHSYFSELRWNDRVNVSGFSDEFTMTQPSDELWLVTYFESNGLMNLNPAGNGPYMYQGSGLINDAYETNALPTYLTTDEIFKWQQLIAYWEATSGDMIPDATFGGVNYTLRCPTTTHLKESLERGYAAGNYEEIKDYPCLVPWYGCSQSS